MKSEAAMAMSFVTRLLSGHSRPIFAANQERTGMLSRRALFSSVTATAVTFAAPRLACAQAAGPYALPPLPYAFDANEPHIDTITMQIHHGRHHATFVANLNAAVKDYPQLATLAPDGLVSRTAEIPESIRTAVRNGGGGHANHTIFWQISGR